MRLRNIKSVGMDVLVRLNIKSVGMDVLVIYKVRAWMFL